MTHILKNENLEIHVDEPKENYNFSRFDWTGKIVEVIFQNTSLASIERTDCTNENFFGKGFYNEFGIDTALGFDDAEIGGWFHKIGVGLLKKEDNQYLFTKNYKIKPADFQIITESNKITIICTSHAVNGYAYVLKKEIELHANTFTITYNIHNTGEKEIITDEYVHNFTAIDKEDIGPNYVLNFPFPLKPERFEETVNPEKKVDIGQNKITFNRLVVEQFFFSNLSGNAHVNSKWELINLKSKIGISETASFKTDKVNLWGWKHVISPELFNNVCVKPGKSVDWTRTYRVFKVT